MFVYHVKINGSKVFKSIFIGMLILFRDKFLNTIIDKIKSKLGGIIRFQN